jgi:YjbE family integral membrane protein
VGGLALLWIGIKLLGPSEEEGHEIEGSASLSGAIRTVIIADFVMSLDNVIGVAGAAKGNFTLLVFGLLVSIPLVVVGSKLVLRALDRFPAVIVLGGALLGWIAGDLIATDPLTAPHLAGLPSWTHLAFSATGAFLVVAVAKWLLRRQGAARDSRETP